MLCQRGSREEKCRPMVRHLGQNGWVDGYFYAQVLLRKMIQNLRCSD